jgi:hypothetical protein
MAPNDPITAISRKVAISWPPEGSQGRRLLPVSGPLSDYDRRSDVPLPPGPIPKLLGISSQISINLQRPSSGQ